MKVPGNGESAIELIDFNMGLSRVIKTMATNVFWVLNIERLFTLVMTMMRGKQLNHHSQLVAMIAYLDKGHIQ